MMIWPRPFSLAASVIFLVVIATFPNQGEGACTDMTNLIISNINEQMKEATILNITKDQPEAVTFNVKNAGTIIGTELARFRDIFFVLSQTDTYFSIQLRPNTSLDLELIFNDFHSEVTTFILEVRCDNAPYDVNIIIKQVNEFNPVFTNSPYSVSVNESLPVESTVFDLTSRVSDGDIPRPQNYFYNIHPYLITDIDGQGIFKLEAQTKGLLLIRSPLDYDKTPRHYWRLNVSVTDGPSNDVHARTTFTTINITVTDADDQNPYFDIPGCSRPCIAPPYEASISTSHKGQVKVFPVAIHAKDNDTLGTPLEYTIDGQNYGMFHIDINSGEVTQTTSVFEAKRNDSAFRMVIKVKKQTNHELSAIAILSVKVAGRQPNVTIPVSPEDTRTTTEKSDLMIPVIILGILLLFLIAAIIIVVLLMRKKQKQLLVSPEHDNEPQTEEEEIGTDRSDEYNTMGDHNEKLVFGANGKVTRAISTDMYPTPTQKANALPPLPLRDSATETTEGRKKRSRKRNKNKEPEIFDGTREYNMGLDTEFFESGDKSRIKRSHRSKKADSSQPISVPNDNPAEEKDQIMHM